MSRAPSEVEQFNDRIRKAHEIADWSSKVYAMYGASFVERYMQANAYLAIRMAGVGNRKDGFLIKALPVRNSDVRGKADKHDTAWKHEGVEQATMFPGEIETMEGAKQVIPSGIWPEVFDDILIDLGKPLYLFQDATPGVQKVSFGFPNGKVSTCGFSKAAALGQGTSKQIETAANAVDDDPRLSIDKRVERLKISGAVDFFAGLRIGINSHGIGFVTLPFNDAFLQHWELGYGPIDGGLCI